VLVWGRGCRRSTGIEPWALAVRAAWATILAIASVPHETWRVFVTEGLESSAALVIASVSHFAARRAAGATELRNASG
jgi:hypothetical protein